MKMVKSVNTQMLQHQFSICLRCFRINIKTLILMSSFIAFLYLASQTFSSTIIAKYRNRESYYKYEKVKNHYQETNYILVTNRSYVEEFLDDYRIIWDKDTVALYRQQLGICSQSFSEEKTFNSEIAFSAESDSTEMPIDLSCFLPEDIPNNTECKNKIVVTAFTSRADDIETALWEMLSLDAITMSYKEEQLQIMPYLSSPSFKVLDGLFVE